MATAAKKTAPSPKNVARAAEAGQSEDTPQPPVDVEHHSITYSVPVGLDIPIELLEAESDLDAIRAVLGEDQWNTYRDSKPTLRDFREFADKVIEASGIDSPGN